MQEKQEKRLRVDMQSVRFDEMHSSGEFLVMYQTADHFLKRLKQR
jgi:hypothetical protein